MTFATGARQFVVQDAFETTLCFAGSYNLSFTPSTNVASGPSAGAEISTFFTDPRKCAFACSPFVNKPVDSTTMSAPTLGQSIATGSFCLNTLNERPSTEIESSVCVIVCGKFPKIESYFKRCASVFASVTSFTATNWMSLSSIAVLTIFRPMRPKPLIATLMGMLPPVIYVQCALWEQAARNEQKRLWVAPKIVNESAVKLFLWRQKVRDV